MTGSDHSAAPGSTRRRGGRVGRLLLGAVLTLAVLGAAALVFSDDERLLRLGIVAALWAALVGAFAAARYRREGAAGHDRGEELRRVYELELEREVAARREYELEVEADTRRRLGEEVRDEVRVELDGVRTELRTLRQNLEALLGGEVLVERVALRAESTRLRSLSDQSRAVRSALPRGSSTEQWAGEIVTGHLDPRSAFDAAQVFDNGRTGQAFDGSRTGQWPRDPAQDTSAWNANARNGDPTRTGQQRPIDPRAADLSRTGQQRVADVSRTGQQRAVDPRAGDPSRTGQQRVGDLSRTGQQRAGDPSRTGTQRAVGASGMPLRPSELSSTGQWPRDPAGPPQPGRPASDRSGTGVIRAVPANGRPAGQPARPGPPDPTDILPRYQGPGSGSPEDNPFGTWAPQPNGNGRRPDTTGSHNRSAINSATGSHNRAAVNSATGSHNRADIASQTAAHNRGAINSATGHNRADVASQTGGHRRADVDSSGSHGRAEILTTGGHRRADVSTGGHRRAEIEAVGGRRRAEESSGGRRRADDSGGGHRRAAEPESTSGRRRRADDSGSHAVGRPAEAPAPANDEPRSGRRRRRDDA